MQSNTAQTLIAQRPNGFYCKKYFIGLLNALGVVVCLFLVILYPFVIIAYNMPPGFYFIEILFLLALAITSLGTYGALWENLRCMKIFFGFAVFQCILLGILVILRLAVDIYLSNAWDPSGIPSFFIECGWTYLVYLYVQDLKMVANDRAIV